MLLDTHTKEEERHIESTRVQRENNEKYEKFTYRQKESEREREGEIERHTERKD